MPITTIWTVLKAMSEVGYYGMVVEKDWNRYVGYNKIKNLIFYSIKCF